MENHPNVELAIRLKRALQSSRLTAAALARELDESPQAVNGWLKTGRIRKAKLAAFAKATGVNLNYLITGETPDLVTEAPPTRYTVLRDVPIVGHAIASPNEDGFFTDMGFPAGAGEGFVPWPTTDPHAYALRVRGDSMQPRIRPGELIVVEPSRAVQPGDDIVVRTTDGRKMVKQLLLRRAGEVTLGSINQEHQQITVLVEQIEFMHFVAAIVPRNAFTKDG